MAPLTHLEVVTAPLVNHAMAHNGIRVVRQITLVSSPDLDGGHTDVVLTARLVDAHSTVLTRPWRAAAPSSSPKSNAHTIARRTTLASFSSRRSPTRQHRQPLHQELTPVSSIH